MSIQVALNCKVKDEAFKSLLKFLEKNIGNVRGFEGNVRVTVRYDSENNEMLLDEEWLSVQHHENYLKYIEDNGVLSALVEFFKEPPKINYYETINICCGSVC